MRICGLQNKADVDGRPTVQVGKLRACLAERTSLHKKLTHAGPCDMTKTANRDWEYKTSGESGFKLDDTNTVPSRV